MTITTGGTLVIVAPTKNSSVVAADSRRSVDASTYINEVKKVGLLTGRKDLAFFATGDTIFLGPRPPHIEMTDWIREAPPKYEVRPVLGEFLSKTCPIVVDEAYLDRFADHCASHLVTAHKRLSIIDHLPPGQTRPILTAGVIQYNPKTKPTARTVGSFTLTLTCETISHDIPKLERFSDSDPFTYRGYGETDYFRDHVASGAGLRFAPSRFQKLHAQLRSRSIRKANQTEVVWLCRDMIETAARMSEEYAVKPKKGIGVPIYSYVIDGIRKPATGVGEVMYPIEQPQPLVEDLHRNG
jgi:hypothetical protein